ncbi:uncharacterized protein LOC135809471 [Sycon ciliatum]|uniref:uncharacterized protein LOC135809471 n=1 Tax=Sycon ciliatum TaxID=27933 RepID=UPI0031F68AF4
MAAVLPQGVSSRLDSQQLLRGRKSSKFNSLNLDIQVVSSELHSRLVEAGLIRDRRARLRTISKCFLASEVIDFFLDNAEIHSRNDAAGIFSYLVFKGLVHHVTDELSTFEDGNFYYRFRVDDESRKRRTTAATFLSYRGSFSGSPSSQSSRRYSYAAGTTVESMKKSTDSGAGTTSNLVATKNGIGLDPALASDHQEKGGLALSTLSRTRTSFMKRRSYPSPASPVTLNVAPGSSQNASAVSYQNKGMCSRASAQSSFDELFVNPDVEDRDDNEAYFGGGEVSKSASDVSNKSRLSVLSSTSDCSLQTVSAREDAVKVAGVLRMAMLSAGLIKDHRFHFTSYRHSFFSLEALQFTETSGFVESRSAALCLMQGLETMGFIHHVTDSFMFTDANHLFRFRLDDGTDFPEMSHDVLLLGENVYQEAHHANPPAVRDRTYKGKIYSQCFIASELLDLLMTWEFFSNRKEALNFCKQLVTAGMVHHVCYDHHFKDDFLFFRFTDDDPVNESQSISLRSKLLHVRVRRLNKLRRNSENYAASRSPLSARASPLRTSSELEQSSGASHTPVSDSFAESSPGRRCSQLSVAALAAASSPVSSPLLKSRPPLRPPQELPSLGRDSNSGSSSDSLVESDDDDDDDNGNHGFTPITRRRSQTVTNEVTYARKKNLSLASTSGKYTALGSSRYITPHGSSIVVDARGVATVSASEESLAESSQSSPPPPERGGGYDSAPENQHQTCTCALSDSGLSHRPQSPPTRRRSSSLGAAVEDGTFV